MKIFKLPDLGEGLQEAEIVKWHIKVGDVLTADQPMVSVETAKAVVDIPAPFPGKVAKLYGNAGDIAHIGAPLVAFEGESEVVWFEGNYQDYEADRHKRLGAEADQPHRIKYKPLVRQ